MFATSFVGRGRCCLVCAPFLFLLLPAVLVFPGCSDDSVSPGGPGPTTIDWTIENPTFFAQDLYAVWAVSPSDVWAGGSRGELIHFDGSSWQRVDAGTDEDIFDIFGTSPECVFAVGGYGLVLKFDGAGWTPIGPDDRPYLDEVWASSETDVFAVGRGSVSWASAVYHYDGTAWSEMAIPEQIRLRDIWGASGDDVYAVGEMGVMIHYDGTEWSAVELPSVPDDAILTGVFGRSAADIYVVGYELVLHFDGIAWSVVEDIPAPPENEWHYEADWFTAVWVNENGEAFAVSYWGDVVRYDGASWEWIRVPVDPCVGFYSACLGGSGAELFVTVGDPGVLHYEGDSWGQMMGHVLDLNDVWGSSDRDVFAVGDRGTILHFDGSEWSQMSSGTCHSLYGVWGTSPSDVFAVGSEVVVHFDGAKWTRVYLPSDNLMDVWGTSPDDVFCVGRSGIHHFDGSGWEVWWAGANLTTVWGAASNDVYAAGGISLFHFDGKEWTVLPGDEDFRVTALAGAGRFGRGIYGAGEWRTGYDPCVARLGNDGWTPVHQPSCENCGSATLYGLWIGGNGTIVAVGGRPPLVTFYDGRAWEDEVLVDRPAEIAERIALNDVWSDDGVRFFAVGDRGLIVRGER